MLSITSILRTSSSVSSKYLTTNIDADMSFIRQLLPQVINKLLSATRSVVQLSMHVCVLVRKAGSSRSSCLFHPYPALQVISEKRRLMELGRSWTTNTSQSFAENIRSLGRYLLRAWTREVRFRSPLLIGARIPDALARAHLLLQPTILRSY